MSAWEGYGLHDDVVAALVAQGFTAPTPIQHECLPAAILGNADVIGAAETGSGKTLAFALPILNLLCTKRRELAEELEADAAAEEGLSEDGEGDQPVADLLDEAEATAEADPGADSSSGTEDGVEDGSPCSSDAGGDDQELSGACSLDQELLQDVVDVDPVTLFGGDDDAGESRPRLRALVLCPTRELALQVHAHFMAIAGPLGVSCAAVTGGMARQKQERLLKKGPEVVIGTPGRLWDLHRSGNVHLTALAGLRFLVIDEADRMIKQGQFEELQHLLDLVCSQAGQAAPHGRQQEPRGSCCRRLHTYLFSATLTLPDSAKARLQKGKSGSRGSAGGASLQSIVDSIPFRGKPKVADMTAARRVAAGVTELCVRCSESERDVMLYYVLVATRGSTLVFMNTISSVRRVCALLRTLGMGVNAIHAQQQQRQRLKALDRFKTNANGVLLATDVAARGLDIPAVACVVHYQLPPTADTYIHRAGRTGRAGACGASVAFVVPAEAGRFKALEGVLGRGEPQGLPVDAAVLPDIGARVRLAARIDTLERGERKVKVEEQWLKRHADGVDIDLEDHALPRGSKQVQRGRSNTAVAAQLRSELQDLLAEPLHQRLNAKFFTGGMSQMMAAAVMQSAGNSTVDGAAVGQGGVSDDAAACGMRRTIDAVQAIAAKRARVCDVAQGKNCQARVTKGKTLGQLQMEAMHAAVAKRRLKKGQQGGRVQRRLVVGHRAEDVPTVLDMIQARR